ncbi:MAG: HPP family protein [Bacillota bacterium]
MMIVDEKFRKNKLQYLGQCALAMISILVVQIFLDVVLDAAVIASLGASCFIIFLLPHVNSSKSRFIIGGYIVGISSAFLCSNLSKIQFFTEFGLNHRYWIIMLGSITVGLSMLLMVLTDTEHPPAAGMALGLVIDGFNYKTVVIVLVGIVLLCFIRFCLRKRLINLL